MCLSGCWWESREEELTGVGGGDVFSIGHLHRDWMEGWLEVDVWMGDGNVVSC